LLQLDSNWSVLTETVVASILRPRQKYDHKGVFGHVLLIAGSYGKAGAAILASRAAMRAGAGLMTVHIPESLYSVLQNAVPEAMVATDINQFFFTGLTTTSKGLTIGIGCGLGTKEETAAAVRVLLDNSTTPLVIDGDALNAISLHQEMLELIPQNSILTPHLKEFDRLFGASANHFDRLDKLLKAAVKYHIVIVLKGAHSAIGSPEGKACFNTTGNPGMATGGSGDVLTGIITALLAQGYSPLAAAQAGVWLHGLAGDIAADETGYEALIASDIIDHLGAAFQHLHDIKLLA